MKLLSKVILPLALLICMQPKVYAGVYGNELSKCLVESSTADDKLVFVKWMFTAMSLHPHVKPLSKVTPKQRDDSDKNMANIFLQLMTVRCVDQAKKALQYEGQTAIESSFRIFGQVAARELFSHPDVANGLSGLERHVDSEKLRKTLGIQ